MFRSGDHRCTLSSWSLTSLGWLQSQCDIGKWATNSIPGNDCIQEINFVVKRVTEFYLGTSLVPNCTRADDSLGPIQWLLGCAESASSKNWTTPYGVCVMSRSSRPWLLPFLQIWHHRSRVHWHLLSLFLNISTLYVLAHFGRSTLSIVPLLYMACCINVHCNAAVFITPVWQERSRWYNYYNTSTIGLSEILCSGKINFVQH